MVKSSVSLPEFGSQHPGQVAYKSPVTLISVDLMAFTDALTHGAHTQADILIFTCINKNKP